MYREENRDIAWEPSPPEKDVANRSQTLKIK